jgi:hypothetical protein
MFLLCSHIHSYSDATIERAEELLQLATQQQKIIAKVAMAKLSAAGNFVDRHLESMVKEFGQASKMAVIAGMKIATVAKMAGVYLYNIDMPEPSDFVGIWEEMKGVFADITIDWENIDISIDGRGISKILEMIGKMKRVDILKVLTEAANDLFECPNESSATTALIEDSSYRRKKSLHQVAHQHKRSLTTTANQRKNTQMSKNTVTIPLNLKSGPCDIDSSIDSTHCCCSWASECVIIRPFFVHLYYR